MKKVLIYCIFMWFIFYPPSLSNGGTPKKEPVVVTMINYNLVKHDLLVKDFFDQYREVSKRLDTIKTKLRKHKFNN